jgi:hypothetical protein
MLAISRNLSAGQRAVVSGQLPWRVRGCRVNADIWSGRASTTRLNHILVDSVDRLFAPIRPHRRVRPLRRRLGWPQLDCLPGTLPEASESETRSMLRSTPDEGERSYRHAIASRCLARLWDPQDALTLPRGAAAATPWLPWCRQVQPSHHSDSALSTLATREINVLICFGRNSVLHHAKELSQFCLSESCNDSSYHSCPPPLVANSRRCCIRLAETAYPVKMMLPYLQKR